MTASPQPLLLSPLRFDHTSGELLLIDQLALPGEEVWHRYSDYRAVADAIRKMVVRGAPAIGIAAAFGVVLGKKAGEPLEQVIATLRSTRPTAVNLFWALDRMQRRAAELSLSSQHKQVEGLLSEAQAIWDEDVAMCLRMAEHGAPLLPPGHVLTHCNAGGLATGGYGTAVGVIRTAFAQGHIRGVFADETRPFLQGARLTAWELLRAGVPASLLPDTAAAALIASGLVQVVVTGADRIAMNGDSANKIGTYGLALAAARHGVPFYIAAPRTTIDPACADGAGIPIEFRPAAEVGGFAGVRWSPAGAGAYNPAFDVTPAELITGIVTEVGVAWPPYSRSMAGLLAQP